MQASSAIYQVKANEFLFSLSEKDLATADLLQLSANEFNLLMNRQSINAKISGDDLSGKKITVEIEGNEFTIEIKDRLDQLLDQMGFGAKVNKTIKEIKAPMPGLVLEIAVSDGQQVKEGDKLLILEAMKMENSIVIQTTATIRKIAVKAGQAVERGQLLVELE